MSKGLYRQIYINIWREGDFCEEFTAQERYFYLYLLTNPNTNLLGCYELPMKIACMELGYDKEEVKKLLNRMVELDKIVYNPETKEVLIQEYYKNWTESPKYIEGLKKETKDIKSEEFRNYFEYILDSRDRVYIPYVYGMDTAVTHTEIEVEEEVAREVAGEREGEEALASYQTTSCLESSNEDYISKNTSNNKGYVLANKDINIYRGGASDNGVRYY